MKLAFLCSPLRATSPEEKELNIKFAQNACHTIISRFGYNSIAPHLFYPQFLDDENDTERALGLKLAKDLLKRCDVIFVFTGRGISAGMAQEIKFANSLNKRIVYLNN